MDILKSINGDKVIEFIIPAVITIFVAVFTIKHENKSLKKTIKNEMIQNNKALKLQHITDKRIDWMYTVRNITSEYIGLILYSEHQYRFAGKDIPTEIYRDINEKTAKMRLFYNFAGFIDKKILDVVADINRNIGNKEYKSQKILDKVELLTKYSQVYFKLEWERVKMETYQNLLDEEEEFKKKIDYELEKLLIKYSEYLKDDKT